VILEDDEQKVYDYLLKKKGKWILLLCAVIPIYKISAMLLNMELKE
jgi:hypothetical protein